MRELIDVEMLRALRTARGLSQGALASLAGVDRTVVARLERGGQKDVRLSVLLGLARALHVSIEKLVLIPHTADSPAPHLSQDLAAAVAALDSLAPEIQHQIAAIIHAYLTTLPRCEMPSPHSTPEQP
ncbi:MAG: helix-turn-helix transcriptional regulator [Chloroflexales bacterium]